MVRKLREGLPSSNTNFNVEAKILSGTEGLAAWSRRGAFVVSAGFVAWFLAAQYRPAKRNLSAVEPRKVGSNSNALEDTTSGDS